MLELRAAQGKRHRVAADLLGEFRSGQRRDWDKAAHGWESWQEFVFGSTAQ